MITRIKKSLAYVPASLKEATSLLVSIGEKQREINRVKREAKQKVEAINTEAKKSIEELTRERDTFFTALFAFASPRKKELTKVPVRKKRVLAPSVGDSPLLMSISQKAKAIKTSLSHSRKPASMITFV